MKLHSSLRFFGHFFGLLFGLLTAACAPAPGAPGKKNQVGQELTKPATGAVLGKTRAQEIEQRLGAPSLRTESVSVKGLTFIEYESRPDRLKFQVRDGVVEGEFRAPRRNSPEATLQYWRHRWKGELTRFEPVVTKDGDHGPGLMQFSVPRLGAAVIYDPTLDRVTRLVRYAN